MILQVFLDLDLVVRFNECVQLYTFHRICGRCGIIKTVTLSSLNEQLRDLIESEPFLKKVKGVKKKVDILNSTILNPFVPNATFLYPSLTLFHWKQMG